MGTVVLLECSMYGVRDRVVDRPLQHSALDIMVTAVEVTFFKTASHRGWDAWCEMIVFKMEL
jgi:hypothetical protein